MTDVDVTTEVGGNKMPTKQQKTEYFTLDVAPITADGSQKFVMELTIVAGKQSMMGMNMEYDSTDEKATYSFLKDAGIMAGVKVSMLFDRDGKLVKAEGLDEFLEDIVKKDPSEKQVVEFMKTQATIDGFSTLITTPKNAIPKNPVAKGKKWTRKESYPVPALGNTDIEMEHTYMGTKKIDGKELFEIQLAGETKEESRKFSAGPGMEIALNNADISFENVCLIDLASGMPYSLKSNAKLDLEFNADNTGMGKQKITGKMDWKAEYKEAK